MEEEVKDPFEFICQKCKISSSQEDDLLHNIGFARRSSPHNSARITVSSIQDERGKVSSSSHHPPTQKSPAKTNVQQIDPFEFISKQCNISSSQEDDLQHNILFARESSSVNSARITVSSIQDERGKVASSSHHPLHVPPSQKSPAKINDPQMDPFEFLCKQCNISSSQEDDLQHNILFARESPPVNSARITVSSVQDERGKVASRSDEAPQHPSIQKSPAKINVLQSPPPPPPPPQVPKEVLVFPPRGPSLPSSSNFKVPEDQNLGDVDILEIFERKGIIFPRPRWWRPEGYEPYGNGKEDKDPKPKRDKRS